MIDDCLVDFKKLKEFFIYEPINPHTREFVTKMCIWMDPSWTYVCDETNNTPLIVDEGDIMVSCYKRTLVGYKTFNWSIKNGIL